MYKCIKQLTINVGIKIVFVYGEEITAEEYCNLSLRQQKYFLKQ